MFENSPIEIKLKTYYDFAMINYDRLGSFDQRHLDNAYKAVNITELDFIIENTLSKSVQDYAILKKNFFYNKGIR